MTWTFSNNPGGSNRDLIRTLVSDTNTSRQLLTDEFIAYTLAAKPNVYLAAALCAETLVSSTAATAAYLASNITRKKVGDLELSYGGGGSAGGSAADHYRALAKTLRLQAASRVAPFSGGISVDDKQTQQDDTDWSKPPFRLGQHDYDSLSTSTGLY